MTKDLFSGTKIWLINADLDLYSSLNDKKKSVFLSIFYYLMSVVLVFFIIMSMVRTDYRHALIDSSILTCISAAYFLFRKKKMLAFSSHFFVFCLAAVIVFYSITGGIEHTGLLFSLLMPLPILLLLGRKRGIVILFAFLVVIITCISIGRGQWAADYSYNYLLRVAICFILISFLAYLNEMVFEQIYLRLQKTAESLEKSREDYKNLSINREKFLSIISHDLKNQLAGFYSASEMLDKNYTELDESGRKDLIHTMADSSEKNMHLLHDLLRWTMIKEDTFPCKPSLVKIEKVYREVLELFESEIEKKKISVFLKVKSNSEVFADYDMLCAIVRNLVSNAVKYTHENGQITIKAKEKGDFMEISVTDNGPGIPAPTLERIQQALSIKPNDILYENSTGIGLLLIKEFVQCNNGKIKIDSSESKGTSVAFSVPLAD